MSYVKAFQHLEWAHPDEWSELDKLIDQMYVWSSRVRKTALDKRPLICLD